ncbi:hypothetical protein [Marinomonas mediterranea]|jgi:hypothetical protein|uniref:Tryptophan synthase subunit beta like protein n=1 Tax=Marinomonas mediterranea (strain ATCC 700492 / JCM 21426 / NBRC 103028 / MMB-1) TaxID=717774 RepID=F2JY30_MARM1|nr:hypothetical protein [Marinomonas mediterranea]ADZ90766.1 hypothetical protein Marme_1499 [Marinomonas mediterranea MMB-1]WCN08807.1 hypothetical protein GV055_07605 [Marinomonas mediterranea]WCN12853.1 hypothetical protein GV054_07395 [Marinomonas mediterranea]WCN16921.1 hypothetical protein GV053_07540 [Marinomonas mediterranea MMB-1]
MLYAKLNDAGEIIDVATQQSEEYSKLVAPDDPVVAGIVESKLDGKDTQELLTTSDQDMMRVLEDLIDLLAEKRLIQFTELPIAAQKKLLSRKWVRGVHNGSNDAILISEDLPPAGNDSLI